MREIVGHTGGGEKKKTEQKQKKPKAPAFKMQSGADGACPLMLAAFATGD